MKKLWTILFLFFGISQATSQEIYEVVSDVYLRGGIGTSSEVVGVLEAGEEVTVLDKTNPVWFKIETSSGSGYVSNKYLKFKDRLNPVSENSNDALAGYDNDTSGKDYGLAFGTFAIILILLFFVFESSRNKRKKKLAISLIENAKRDFHNKNGIPQSQNRMSTNDFVANTLHRSLKTFNSEKGQQPVPLRPVSKFVTKVNQDYPTRKVPFWTDKYIFSNSALESASDDQRRYFFHFKTLFLNGLFPDLEGNYNYAFALLFELLKDYEEHQNFNKLENQLINIGKFYPKVKAYATGSLVSVRTLIHTETGGSLVDNFEPHNQPLESIDSTGNLILDVTDEIGVPFQQPNKADDLTLSVPFWSHKYIYSLSDLEGANPEQKAFYRHFKQKFLEGVCLSLEGNTNYAFILLFDLLQSIEEQKDLEKLEIQVNKLGNVYYKTRQYGIKFLNEIKRKKGLGFQVPETRYHYPEQSTPSETTGYDSHQEYVYWKVGSKYQKKLGLDDEEVGLLNKLWESTNNFTSIEFCYIQTMRLYLGVCKKFGQSLADEERSIEDVFLLIGDLVARFHYRYRKGSSNYKMSLKNISDSLYAQIFKKCENELREHFGIKRKLSTDILFSEPRIKTELESKILNPIALLLSDLITKVPDPDETTLIELNSLNSSRWKTEFDKICEKFKSEPEKFMNSIFVLGELNRKNQSIENIFYEASKFIAPKNSESALILYLHYLHHDLKSVRFDNRSLTKTIQKSIFKSPEQVQQFESIVTEFLQDKSLDKAVKAVSSVYSLKRKKIILNRVSIEEVKQKHAGTVELLNEYLQEDEVDELIPATELAPSSRELTFTITQEQTNVSTFLGEISFKEIHFLALEYFVKNNLSVAISEFEDFAKIQGIFKNQLIDSINEACFDVLDDVLIEEEDEYYTIEPAYFQTISAK